MSKHQDWNVMRYYVQQYPSIPYLSLIQGTGILRISWAAYVLVELLSTYPMHYRPLAVGVSVGVINIHSCHTGVCTMHGCCLWAISTESVRR